MATRYDDAATVSDEHGKGAEILRQNALTDVGSVAEVPIMITEVDTIIRNIKVAGNGTDPAAGTVQVFSRTFGGSDASRVELTASQAVSGMSANDVLEIPLTETRVPKDRIIETTIASLTSNVRVSVIVGWMPDLWSVDADNKTY